MPTHLVARVRATLAAVTAVTAVVAPTAIPSAPGAHSTAVAPKAARVISAATPGATPLHESGASPAGAIVDSEVVPVTHLAPEPIAARRVVLYGDSLAWEARDFFTRALASALITQVTTRTFGGTAICDRLGQMRADAASLRPDAVVVEFSGNALTPCMRAPNGSALTGATYFQKYASDSAAVLDIFSSRHTLVFFAGAPISRDAERAGDPTAPTLHTLYAALARSTPYGRYIDAGASVLAGGRWTATLPCLPTEPCMGRDAIGTPVNVVRAPDGVHFCPSALPAVRGVTAPCSVWASGSWRFGNAMAAPVIAEFESRPQ